jgi:hypothetical protein
MTIDSDMDLPVTVGADSRYGIWMIRAAVGESVEVVHFKVWAPLTEEGSRLEAAFANPSSAFQGVLSNCFCPILDRHTPPFCIG